MALVRLGIGSNIDARLHLGMALDALTEQFGRLRLSPVYESEAVGFAGDNFLNLVAALDTRLSLAELARWLKALEGRHGRTPQTPRFSARTLDLDILTYDDWVGDFDGIRLPRPEILTNAFVLRPLADLAGEARHPETGRTFGSHWEAYRSDQRLWPVAFSWRAKAETPWNQRTVDSP